MVNHYRWDFIGLSTDQKPTPATSEKVVDGSTFYCSDNSKLYVFCKDQWYEKTAEGGGGEPYVLPIASADTLGGIKVGDNLSIDSETGVLSGDYSAFTGTDGTAAGTTGLVPAPATTDAGKFLKADGTWDSAGGSSVTVVQATGTSTTDVMSQNATSSLIYADPGTDSKIRIGSSQSVASNSITIGNSSQAYSDGAISIGYNASTSTTCKGCVALGAYSQLTQNRTGVIYIGTSSSSIAKSYSYDNSKKRIISGLHDAIYNDEAATLAQGNKLMSVAPTTSDFGVLGQLWTDTTNMHTYQCTAISGDTYTWTQRW